VTREDLLRWECDDRHSVEASGACTRAGADRAVGTEAWQFCDTDTASPVERGRSGSLSRYPGCIERDCQGNTDHFPHSSANEKDGGAVQVRRLLFKYREATRFVDDQPAWLSRASSP